MNAQELTHRMLESVERVNIITVREGIDTMFLANNRVGFAVPIPSEATEEAKTATDEALLNLRWKFSRVTIKEKEYYVLFPF